MKEGKQLLKKCSLGIGRANSSQETLDMDQLSNLIGWSSGIARHLGEPFLVYLLGMAAAEVHSISERRKYLSSTD